MNLLFLSDTLGIEGPVIRQVFLEYMKLDSNLMLMKFSNKPDETFMEMMKKYNE